MSVVKSRFSGIGLDGLGTLILSNMIILLTVGFSLGWCYWWTYRKARDTAIKAPPKLMLVVLGKRLQQGQITEDFTKRLERAYKIYRRGNDNPIMVVGGSSDAALVTEARKGFEYLISRGVRSADVLMEDSSRHTLENLQNVRTLLKSQDCASFVLITSRYHIARGEEIAEGLGMRPVLCSAEDMLEFSLQLATKLLMEAYYIHWYRVGAVWSTLTRNEKSLARIR